jgi:ribosomal protein S12 methylthiotransferase
MKVGFVSLGCPKNLVDSEVMMGLVERAGHELVSDPGRADAIVVNTCAFIEAARQESVDTILEMAGYKRGGRCRRLVVTGCLAERYGAELTAEMPEIDAVLGTGDVPDIVPALGRDGRAGSPVRLFRRRAEAAGAVQTQRARSLPTYIYDAETPRRLATPQHYAYVKVAEGCDYTCAFCIIPTLRGRYRSRPASSIVAEARALVERGVREIVLVSQDTTYYGVDRGERGALARLLRALDRVEGLAWIRLLYLYPTTIADDVLDAMADCERVCKYIDLPLQHASRAVLTRMRRPGHGGAYLRLLRRIRDRVPGVALRSTFVVGFPGETEGEFGELCAFVDDARFDHLGVFTYSHEEGTPAHAVPDDVPRAVKERRRGRLMERQRRLVAGAGRRLTGSRLTVLIDGAGDTEGLVLRARHQGQAPEIDSVVYLTECDPSGFRPGQLVDALVVGAHGYDLVAAPLVRSLPLVV